MKNKEHRSGVIKNKKDKPSTSWPDLDLGEENFILDYEPEIPEPEPEQAALIPVAEPLRQDCVMQMVKQLKKVVSNDPLEMAMLSVINNLTTTNHNLQTPAKAIESNHEKRRVFEPWTQRVEADTQRLTSESAL